MSECRDWLRTLFPASFKGVPFYCERDTSEGGRRVVIHEFPYRDDPFLEDLGESPGQFAVSAYVASDLADIEAKGLMAILASEGPGLLVLPTVGPIMVRAISFSRDASKDTHGYIALALRFVREGATAGGGGLGALISEPFLGQMVFAAVNTLVGVAARVFSVATTVIGQADYVIDAAVGTVQDAASAFEVIRSTYPVEAKASADTRDRLVGLYADAPVLISRAGADPAVVTGLFGIARDMAEAMDGATAAQAFAGVVDTFTADPIPVGTAGKVAAAGNRLAAAQATRLAAISAYAEALTRRTYGSRPEGISARAEAMERFDAELAAADGAAGADLYVALQGVRGALVEYLSHAITDLAPVVTVEAPISMPSLWWAWRLYGDPARAGELVARNGVKHPSFMPVLFEALGS